jgi:endonuclease/exonuclease/phosphatase (EEP) superfamily protein YafD
MTATMVGNAVLAGPTIDHILSRHAPADNIATVALPGSDHRALLALPAH